MNMKYVLCVLLLAFTAAGFAGDDSALMPSAEGAAVGFANLKDGDVVPPGFTVKFSIAGMGIAPAGVQIDNTGHHHLLIDVAELPDFSQPLPATDNIIHFGKGESEFELNLPEGRHTLQLVLADYRHLPHEPPVVSEPISITVREGAPEPTATEQN